MWKIKNKSGKLCEELSSVFCHKEIQNIGDIVMYRIETIIQERFVGGRKQYLVKLYGYPSSFNIWVTDVARYHN